MKIKTELYKNLLVDLAPFKGAGNTASREYLATRLRISDRKLRKLIAIARNDGCPIISNSDNNGYYISYLQEDILGLTHELRSRAIKLLQTAHKLECAMWRRESLELDFEVE